MRAHNKAFDTKENETKKFLETRNSKWIIKMPNLKRKKTCFAKKRENERICHLQKNFQVKIGIIYKENYCGKLYLSRIKSIINYLI